MQLSFSLLTELYLRSAYEKKKKKLLISSLRRLIKKAEIHSKFWQEQIARASNRKSYEMALAFILCNSYLLMLLFAFEKILLYCKKFSCTYSSQDVAKP